VKDQVTTAGGSSIVSGSSAVDLELDVAVRSPPEAGTRRAAVRDEDVARPAQLLAFDVVAVAFHLGAGLRSASA
jgi:hypothetical protein